MLGPGKWTHEDGKSTCSKICSVTNELFILTIDTPKYHRWMHGKEHIQTVLPDMSPENREFLISGTTPEMWKNMFDGSEE